MKAQTFKDPSTHKLFVLSASLEDAHPKCIPQLVWRLGNDVSALDCRRARGVMWSTCSRFVLLPFFFGIVHAFQTVTNCETNDVNTFSLNGQSLRVVTKLFLFVSSSGMEAPCRAMQLMSADCDKRREPIQKQGEGDH
jgi:hypothetical protein